MKTQCIAICDDDEGVMDIAKIVLEAKDYKVVTIDHTKDITAQVKEFSPDLILLDLWMPKKSGQEIFKELKRDVSTKHIPVIIVSASKDIKKISKNLNAKDYICKPFDIKELEDKVAFHLNQNLF